MTDCPVCPILRKRLHDVEEAAEQYLAVVQVTGEARMKAAEVLTQALSSDFRTAVLMSHDMTPEQRDYWLAESDKHEAAHQGEEQP